MRNFFRRKSTSSEPTRPQIPRRLSLPTHHEIEVLHWRNRPNGQNPTSEEILPTASDGLEDSALDDESVALSETETLAYSKQQRMELQDTFDDNYVAYLPYVLRRLRHEHEIETGQFGGHAGAINGVAPQPSSDSDDEKTVASISDERALILRRETAQYNYKRQMVVVSEFIKNSTYVFSDRDSFRTFKYLRSNSKKLRKNSFIVYESDGKIKRILGKNSVPDLSEESMDSGNIVDSRNHLIPLEYKLKGSGLPLFKIVVPYMSSFRKKVPYMVFRRYKEVPGPPSLRPDADEDEKFETYDFCAVHLKAFQKYKRYVLHFTPENAAPFKIIAFQNNFRPFTDFNYKDTRFRVVGSSLVTAYLMNYVPELKLIVIDRNQVSLCDSIVNKRLHLARGISATHASESVVPTAPEDLDNPVPHEDNAVLKEEEVGFVHVIKKNYIPNDMPPFGRFLDSIAYPVELLLLPKKYTEVGKIDLYQPLSENTHSDMTSTLSVNLDQMVLSTVLLTLRETALRTTNRHSNTSLLTRMGTMGAGQGIRPSAGMAFSTTL